MYTLSQLQERRSVRSYTAEPIPDAVRRSLNADISELNSHLHGLRLQIVYGDDTPFRGRMGSYGMFAGVGNYVAAVIDTGVQFSAERAGYGCQQIVMDAVTHGLGTCFVGGTFSAQAIPVQVRAGEKIEFIVTLGYAAEKTRTMARLMAGIAHRKKMGGRDFFDAGRSAVSYDEAVKRYPLLAPALDAVSCAPSAMNRRPERFYLDSEGTVRAFVKDYTGLNPVDLGIAKYNFAQLLPGEWDFGNDTPFLPLEE